MPIFMDRHDVTDAVTAENIAHIHQEDLKIQHHFGCRVMTYWFDDKRKTAFCLIEAPDPEAISKMHNQAHGQVPNTIIEVDATLVESFLGRIEDPANEQESGLNIINDPAFRAIMVISLDEVLNRKSEPLPFQNAFSNFGKEISKKLIDYCGNPVKQTDDYYLVSFKSISKAVAAALDIQALYKEFIRNDSNGKIILRIGLSCGVPVNQNKLIFEDTIKLAERISKISTGEINVSHEVKDLYKSENENNFIQGNGIVSLSPSDEKFIKLLMDYMDKVWDNSNLKVDDFSKPLGLSKSQLYRKMILLTGKSPHTFIMHHRLREALKLLRKNAGNISEIAFETGFSSPSYFTKCFKRQFGLLPADYVNSRQ